MCRTCLIAGLALQREFCWLQWKERKVASIRPERRDIVKQSPVDEAHFVCARHDIDQHTSIPMPRQPLFSGLVIDESGNIAESALVGDEPCYVVDDAGFRRHIPSEQVDRVVLAQFADLMKGSEGLISEQAPKRLGRWGC